MTGVSLPPVPSISIVSGPRVGERLELTSGELELGRDASGLKLDDKEVSRRHAVVRVHDGDIEIEDLGSLNGTFVDGVRIAAPTLLAPGANVRLGATTFVLEVGASEGTVLAPDPDATHLGAEPPAPPPATEAPLPPAVPHVEPPPAVAPPPVAPPPIAPPPVAPPRAAPPPPAPPPPAPPPQPPAPPLLAAPSPVAPHVGAFAPPTPRRHRRVATRMWVPAVATFVVIGATALALLIYFATR